MTSDDRLSSLAGALEAAFPDAGAVRPLRVLGEGFSSVAVATAGGVVFRVGRIPLAAEGYRRERRLLPWLAPRLPAPVPAPRWHAEPSPAFPHGALGYPLLPGEPLHPARLAQPDANRIAADAAAFLAALHAVPGAEAEAAGIEAVEPFEPRMAGLRDAVLPVLRERLAADELGRVARWWDALLADARMRAYAPAPRHGDFWYENLLAEGGRLAGVVDWEDAALGDPAEDFAPLLYLGRDFAERVLAAYHARGGRVDGEVRHRAARWWEAQEFIGIRYSVRHGDREELEDSLRKLRAGPLLDPRAARFD
ncbi:MAG TPA: phosphotransferase [Longimicrobium sp.]|jgi:aminoglycoside phosphotransferase (APT) family kinase protein